jgi:ABC-type transporter Mla subunit MlaD
MSLGPPFDASGLPKQHAVGAGVVLALACAVAWVLTLSGRTVGAGRAFVVEFTTPGPLHVGAKVRLAGREIGEVRGMRPRFADRRVEADVFVVRAWLPHVHQNSTFFVATPSVLGEAYLEIGPPAGGAPPGPPVEEGVRVRGADPPEIDNLLAHSEKNLRLIVALLEESRPELDEALAAGDALLATLSGLPADRGQLGRIRDQFVAALASGSSLLGALRDAGGVERVRRIGGDLSAIADRAGPELRALSRRLDLAMARLDELSSLFSGERRAQLERALRSVRRATASGEAFLADVKQVVSLVESGRGAIGAFLADRELFDDLHETHRIIKSQPWTFILKPIADKPSPYRPKK